VQQGNRTSRNDNSHLRAFCQVELETINGHEMEDLLDEYDEHREVLQSGMGNAKKNLLRGDRHKGARIKETYVVKEITSNKQSDRLGGPGGPVRSHKNASGKNPHADAHGDVGGFKPESALKYSSLIPSVPPPVKSLDNAFMKRTRFSIDSMPNHQAAKSHLSLNHAGFSLVWGLGRPKNLSYFFYSTDVFQKLNQQQLIKRESDEMRRKRLMKRMEQTIAEINNQQEADAIAKAEHKANNHGNKIIQNGNNKGQPLPIYRTKRERLDQVTKDQLKDLHEHELREKEKSAAHLGNIFQHSLALNQYSIKLPMGETIRNSNGQLKF
jgi:hypothetical protein